MQGQGGKLQEEGACKGKGGNCRRRVQLPKEEYEERGAQGRWAITCSHAADTESSKRAR